MKTVVIFSIILLVIIFSIVYIAFIPRRRSSVRRMHRFLWGVIRDRVDGFKSINDKILDQKTRDFFFKNNFRKPNSSVTKVFEARQYSLDIEPVYQWIKNAVRYRNGATGFTVHSMKRISRNSISFEFSDEDFVYCGLIQQQRIGFLNSEPELTIFYGFKTKDINLKHNIIALTLVCYKK